MHQPGMQIYSGTLADQRHTDVDVPVAHAPSPVPVDSRSLRPQREWEVGNPYKRWLDCQTAAYARQCAVCSAVHPSSWAIARTRAFIMTLRVERTVRLPVWLVVMQVRFPELDAHV